MSFDSKHAVPACLRGLAMAVAVTSLAHAADAPPASAPTASTPCAIEARRQFDFWAGEWIVLDGSGKEVGRNRIERIIDGCALQEHWSGRGNVSGSSLNFYDSQDRLWHQVWIDNSGAALYLAGSVTDEGMTLTGTTASAKRPGHTDQQRITWTRRPDGSVRQLWESSVDDGKTWTVAFDGLYVKAP
jgi:hypothetical protein